MSEDVFRFEEPPPAQRRPRQFTVTAQKLRENPGRWALIAMYPKAKRSNAASLARLIRQGRTGDWKEPGDFDACQRTDVDTTRVYARYLGNGGAVDE